MPRGRYTLITAVVAALLLPSPAVATAKGDHSKGASKSRQAERLRQTEQRRLQALVDADVAVAGTLIASDFELINPLGEVLTREAILGGVGAGALDFLADTVTSPIRVRSFISAVTPRPGRWFVYALPFLKSRHSGR